MGRVAVPRSKSSPNRASSSDKEGAMDIGREPRLLGRALAGAKDIFGVAPAGAAVVTVG
jgi:hypothetical protein